MSSDIIKLVEKNNLCTGCGLCESIAGASNIKVAMNDEGYLRPKIYNELKMLDSEVIKDVCPGLNVSHATASKDHHPLWGVVDTISIGAASDSGVRKKGSSGGVLSAIQIYLLEEKIVDYVVNTCVGDENPFDTQVNIAKNRVEILKATGSRYSPSAPLNTIVSLLDRPGTFAFVGKPCDVAALRRLAKHDKRVDDKIKYMLSFMCAGVPSKEGTLRIVKDLGVEESEVKDFRYRGDGWPGAATVTLKDDTTRSMSYEESWRYVLSPRVQWRCKLCPDGTGEFADITGADAWHVAEDGSPDFSERDGQSFIISRNRVGQNLLEQCIKSGYINVSSEVDCSRVEKVQFHQAYRKKTLLFRFLALRLIGLAVPRYNTNILLKATMLATPVSLLRSFAGTVKRGFKMRENRKNV